MDPCDGRFRLAFSMRLGTAGSLEHSAKRHSFALGASTWRGEESTTAADDVQAFRARGAALSLADDRRASGPARQAPARDDNQAHRSSPLRLDSLRAVARATGHVARALMRAITHVEGKPTRSSRGARRGAGCWLRTTVAPAAGHRYRAARLRGDGRRRPVVLSHTRMPGWTSRWGGVGSATLRRIKRRSTSGAGLRLLSLAGCGRRRAADGALACRAQRAAGGRWARRSLVALGGRELGAGRTIAGRAAFDG